MRGRQRGRTGRAGRRAARRGGAGGARVRAITRAQSAGAVGMLIVADGFHSAAAVTAFNARNAHAAGAPATPAAVGGRRDHDRGRRAAVRQAGRPTRRRRRRAARHRGVELRMAHVPRRRRATSSRSCRAPIRRAPASTCSSARTTITTASTPTAVDHDSLRAVNIVTRPQGANDPVVPADGRAAAPDRLADRPRAQHPSAAPRLDHERRRRRWFRHRRAAGDRRAVRDEKPARSIIFVSHTGEEAGLLGSKWFTDHPTIPLDIDRRGAEHGHGRQGTRRPGEVRRADIGADARGAPALAAVRRHHRFGERHAHRDDGHRPLVGRDARIR